jgi:hypothetical protein
MDDPEFARISERDLEDGQHRNPDNHPQYFTTAFLHHPTELADELKAAGFRCDAMLAVEGPAWLLQNFDAHWSNPMRRDRLLAALRRIEADPTLLGASAHFLAIGRKDA